MASAAPKTNDTNVEPRNQVVGAFERFERHSDAYKQDPHRAVGNASPPAYQPDK